VIHITTQECKQQHHYFPHWSYCTQDTTYLLISSQAVNTNKKEIHANWFVQTFQISNIFSWPLVRFASFQAAIYTFITRTGLSPYCTILASKTRHTSKWYREQKTVCPVTYAGCNIIAVFCDASLLCLHKFI
jgi:hypothetical protein